MYTINSVKIQINVLLRDYRVGNKIGIFAIQIKIAAIQIETVVIMSLMSVGIRQRKKVKKVIFSLTFTPPPHPLNKNNIFMWLLFIHGTCTVV